MGVGSKADRGQRHQQDPQPDRQDGEAVVADRHPAGLLAVGRQQPVDELVQVQVVRGVVACVLEESPAVDREQGLEYGVAHQHQREPRGDLGVAGDEEHQQRRRQVAQQVGPAVPGEDSAAGPVKDQEAERRHHYKEAQHEEAVVADLVGDQQKTRQDDQREPAQEPVQAVDEVEAVRHPAHGEDGEEDHQRALAHEAIEPREPQGRHQRLEEVGAEARGDEGQHEPGPNADLLGQVLGEPA